MLLYAIVMISALETLRADFFASDALVQAALGTTSFDGVTYSTTAETLSGVMVDGTTGVNHGTPIPALVAKLLTDRMSHRHCN